MKKSLLLITLILLSANLSWSKTFLFSWQTKSSKFGDTCPAGFWLTWSSVSSSTSKNSCKNIYWFVQDIQQRQQKFVDTNYVLLQEEISQGGGPVLNDYAAILGCPTNAYSVLSDELKANYGNLFNSSSPNTYRVNSKNFIQKSNEVLIKNDMLSKACQPSA